MSDNTPMIEGIPGSDATATKRGFFYQDLATAQAWVRLTDEETLFVEVGYGQERPLGTDFCEMVETELVCCFILFGTYQRRRWSCDFLDGSYVVRRLVVSAANPSAVVASKSNMLGFAMLTTSLRL